MDELAYHPISVGIHGMELHFVMRFENASKI